MKHADRTKAKRRLNALSNAKMMAALLREPLSAHELAEVSGLALYTARHYVLTLHREGAAYIAAWEQDRRGRFVTPAYMLGNRSDVEKPRQSAAVKNAGLKAKRAQRRMLFAIAGGLSA